MSAHASIAAVATLAALTAATAAPAQSIADRISAVGTGTVTMQFTARPGACGDGKDVVKLDRTVVVWPSVFGRGDTQLSGRCDAGPARATLRREGGRTVEIRTSVGAAAAPAGATDLGRVAASSAAEYFLGVAAAADERVARDALMPAALADSADPWPGMQRILRDRGRPAEVRARTAMWGSVIAPRAALPDLERIAADESDVRDVRSAAFAMLADLDDGAGVPSLIRFAAGAPEAWVTRQAVFWLGQTAGDPRALAELRRLVESESTPEALRGDAIFALGQDTDHRESSAILEGVYPRLQSEHLREKVFQALGESDAPADGDWLLDIARDASQSMAARKRAAFWAGQGSVPTDALVRLYDQLREPELRKHLVFVLSQRDDDVAVRELVQIAQHEPDHELRKQAFFWLGQMDDPRALAAIRAALEH